jgi:hypothetical protein
MDVALDDPIRLGNAISMATWTRSDVRSGGLAGCPRTTTLPPMARNLVFVAPFPTEPNLRFVRAVRKADDVRLFGVVHTPPSGEDAKLFDDMVRINEPLSVKDVVAGVEVLRQRHGEPYRILGILEAIMVERRHTRHDPSHDEGPLRELTACRVEGRRELATCPPERWRHSGCARGDP